jgi:hypothetical protein
LAFIFKKVQRRLFSISYWWLFFKLLTWIVQYLHMLKTCLSFAFMSVCLVFKWLANCDWLRILLLTIYTHLK